MKKITFLLAIVVTLTLAGCSLNPLARRGIASQGVCTKEAKLCPDGSSVGRQGPNCEFAPCPENANQNANTNQTDIANPASVNCEEEGGTLEIRTDATGGQVGYCKFSDGSECEEWAFYRDECRQGNISYKIYKNEEYGFEFHYPNNWIIDQQRSTINEVVFDIGIPESREAVRFEKNNKGLSLEQLKANMNIDPAVIYKQSEIEVGGEKAFYIETTEFGRGVIIFNHDDNTYVITTGGRMIENGVISSFKFNK